MNSNELYHHGVKGMKWGVRRYQNKDGSYTSKGKKRRTLNGHTVYNSAKKNRREARKMTDQELRDSNNRLQMEEQYARLTSKKTNAGAKWLGTVIIGAATTVATMEARGHIEKGVNFVKSSMKKKLGR